MILPLPVPADTSESEIRFINLENTPNIFDYLSGLFPKTIFGNPFDWFIGPFMKSGPNRLPVVEVGDYIASYVPTLQDFNRLESCFRLPEATWDQLPLYSDYGFAVFQLPTHTTGAHAMAFEFPRREPDQLFFPTVHIHDGKVELAAHFDHALYCQVSPRPRGWKASFWHPYDHSWLCAMDEEDREFLDLDAKVYRLRLKGTLDNRDTVVASRAL